EGCRVVLPAQVSRNGEAGLARSGRERRNVRHWARTNSIVVGASQEATRRVVSSTWSGGGAMNVKAASAPRTTSARPYCWLVCQAWAAASATRSAVASVGSPLLVAGVGTGA